MTAAEQKCRLHDNSFLFRPELKASYGVVLLNTAFGSQLSKLWHGAQHVVACDGAVNQLYDREDLRSKLLPSAIIGDFDSANPQVLGFYKDQSVEVHVAIDQDKTDLMKAIEFILAKPVDQQPEVIVCYGRLGGRFDHLMAGVNVLHLVRNGVRYVLYYRFF